VLSLAAAWVLFPLVLLAVAAGIGLAIDRVIGRDLQRTLVLPLGAAGAIVIARFVTAADATAELALPAVLACAVAGFVVGRARISALWADRHALLAAAAVFVVVGAPSYMTLEPVFLGYLQLPDTSHQLAIASFEPDNGPNYQKLPDSSYKRALDKYIGTEYPVAPQTTLGVLAPLGVLDIAWLYHPFLAFLAAMGALSLYSLAAAVRSMWLRAAIAFAGAIPALVYSFALQGSIKEIAALSMLLAATAATADLIASRRAIKGLFAVFVPAVAMLGSLGPVVAAYLAPVLLVALVVAGRRAFQGAHRRAEVIAAVVAGAAVLALAGPILSGVQRAYEINTKTLERGGESGADDGAGEKEDAKKGRGDLGNLAAPLDVDNASGVWLNGDYRWRPEDFEATLQPILAAFIALVALAGFIWAIRRRAWGPLLLALGLVPATLVLLNRGTPYADGKVLMLLSPLALVFALLGAAWIWERRRIAGYAVGAIVLGGLLVSQALAYRDSHPAPYERFEELFDINDKLSDSNGTLFTEYDEISEYFLRDTTPYAQPEWAHGYRRDRFRSPSGLSDPDHRPSLKTPIDIDDLTRAYVQSVNAIVMRRSPVMSVPPANFELTYRGRYYEIWERGDGEVTAHLPLGRNVLEPGAIPRCSDVRDLAERARSEGGVLVAPVRPRLARFMPAAAPRAPLWGVFPLYPGSVFLNQVGYASSDVQFPVGGQFRVWAEGSFGRPLHLSVDDDEVGSVQYELGNPGQFLDLGETPIEPGEHKITATQGGFDARPGNGGAQAGLRHLGPVVFSPPSNEDPKTLRVDPADWRSLCDQRLDWVEVEAPAGA
jgi:hypothetical protein